MNPSHRLSRSCSQTHAALMQLGEQALEVNGGQGEPFDIAGHLARMEGGPSTKAKIA